MAGVAAVQQRIVQHGHEFGGFDVRRVFGVELVLLVTGDESEVPDVLVQVGDGKGDGFAIAFEVMQGDLLKVRDDEVARDFLAASGVLQATDVAHALRVRFVEVLSGALVFAEEFARPEDVDGSPSAGEFLHRLLEAGHGAPLDAKDVEELVPERLPLRCFTRLGLPVVAELDGAVFDLVPGQGHSVS